ncbi:MAG: type II toxin-antitoxin system RelE/ParE family toxin [Rhodovibrionaceae bacterium]
MAGDRQRTRVFKTKWFVRFARKEGIEDADLCRAVQRADAGSIDANLGAAVIKQRIARQGEGKSGGYRSIVLFRSGDKAFFAYGFAKNAQDNIRQNELKGFKALAQEMLGYDTAALAKALQRGALVEVKCDEEDL